MKKIALAGLVAFLLLHFLPSSALPQERAEPTVLVEAVPKWNVGDSWKYQTSKELDRVVTQNLGMMQLTMRLDKVETTAHYAVTGKETVEGEECYAVKVSGVQNIGGSYSTTPVEGERIGGDLVQKSAFEGTEYRRVNDLAFVKTIIRAEGTIEIAGILAGVPIPFESNSITVANPPVKQFKFPLIQNDSWHISSVVTTTSSGTSSDTIVITFSYDSKVQGPGVATLDNGKQYKCIVISQAGTQTTQSQNSGISIEDIRGALFFAPSVKNMILDEAEGQKLSEYVPAEITLKEKGLGSDISD